MCGVAKEQLVILLIIYTVPPMDLCSGPVDDIVIGGSALSSTYDD